MLTCGSSIMTRGSSNDWPVNLEYLKNGRQFLPHFYFTWLLAFRGDIQIHWRTPRCMAEVHTTYARTCRPKLHLKQSRFQKKHNFMINQNPIKYDINWCRNLLEILLGIDCIRNNISWRRTPEFLSLWHSFLVLILSFEIANLLGFSCLYLL